MWTVSLVEDPLQNLKGRSDLCADDSTTIVDSFVVRASCSYSQLLSANNDSSNLQVALDEGGHVASVALADYMARRLSSEHEFLTFQESTTRSDGLMYMYEFSLEPLDSITMSTSSSRLALSRRRQQLQWRRKQQQQQQQQSPAQKNGKNGNNNNNGHSILPPYVLERTDIWSMDGELHVDLRLLIQQIVVDTDQVMADDTDDDQGNDRSLTVSSNGDTKAKAAAAAATMLERFTTKSLDCKSLLHHIATVVLQERLRAQLSMDNHHLSPAVAFMANHSILPRKSGASQAPMASPPAVPFMAPADSDMRHTIQVDMGRLCDFLVSLPVGATRGDTGGATTATSSSLVNGQHTSMAASLSNNVISITGLLIPRGVTLIVGGGYHGKSTLLRAIAAGVYNKIPGDGREYCVAVSDAMTVRAEDGRYVNNCNVSAFISNLPSPPSLSLSSPQEAQVVEPPRAKTIKTDNSISAMLARAASTKSTNNNATPSSLDTTHFSTGEASGSTSQAANVVEAVEMGSTAFLVDEDVSAANFMARDGRMRALVMDESITPLLYRVNGLYAQHGISSVVVVGGVGDWLDVPDKVILMDRYLCKDATAKARSISRQFSHGHVQYAGRGVVHRLEWPRSGTPNPRRPTDASARCLDYHNTSIALMDGGHGLHLHVSDQQPNSNDETNKMTGGNNNDDNDEERFIDLSRCEQLLSRKPQIYGCGICALWLLEMSRKHSNLGLAGLLEKMDTDLDNQGFAALMPTLSGDSACSSGNNSSSWKLLVETLGCAYRPRRFEVGQALCRLRGISFEELPIQDDGSEAAAKAEEERKKKELLDMWNARRKNKLHERRDEEREQQEGAKGHMFLE